MWLCFTSAAAVSPLVSDFVQMKRCIESDVVSQPRATNLQRLRMAGVIHLRVWPPMGVPSRLGTAQGERKDSSFVLATDKMLTLGF